MGRNIIFKKSVLQKILFFLILVILVPSCLLSILYYHRTQIAAKQEILATKKQLTEQYCAKISYQLELCSTSMDNIVSDGTIQNILRDGQYQDSCNLYDISKAVSKEIERLVPENLHLSMNQLALYAIHPAIQSDGNYLHRADELQSNMHYNSLLNAKMGKLQYFTDIPFSQSSSVSVFIPIISNDYSRLDWGQRLGFLQINLKKEKFFNDNSIFGGDYSGILYIVDNQQNLIYSNDMGKYFQKMETQLKNPVTCSLTADGIYIQKKIDTFGLTAKFYFPYDEIRQSERDTALYIILTTGILITISLISAFLFAGKLSGRIKKLSKKIQKVAAGRLDVSELDHGNDEISMLDQSINDMTLQLSQLLEENYFKTIEEQRAQITALQYQINPHFLYNTLDCISSMALEYDCQDIYAITQKMGEMFRYNTSNEEYANFSDELQHVKNYLYIQQVRFGKKLEVSYEIDPDTLFVPICRFILQPIVENSITHGFKEKHGTWLISISSVIEDKKLILCVKDNGVGLSTHQLQKLQSDLEKQTVLSGIDVTENLALRNISRRIQLSYGTSYHLTVNSIKDIGTAITITIPCQNNSKDDVS